MTPLQDPIKTRISITLQLLSKILFFLKNLSFTLKNLSIYNHFLTLKIQWLPTKENWYKLSIDAAVNGTKSLMEIGVVVTGQGEF